MRALTFEELELLAGFDKRHTCLGCTAGELKEPAVLQRVRRDLLRGSGSVPLLALAFGAFLHRRGWLPEAPGLEQCRGELFSDEQARVRDYVRYLQGRRTLEEEAVLDLHRRAIHKGSDVRMSTGSLINPGTYPRRAIDPHRWAWRIICSYRRGSGEHINELELYAVLVALRWRCRSRRSILCRYAHLLDSQVIQSVICKSRSSSRRLQHILTKLCSLALASCSQGAFVYVRSADNPADAPSRW
jgi:hypothetical protein